MEKGTKDRTLSKEGANASEDRVARRRQQSAVPGR